MNFVRNGGRVVLQFVRFRVKGKRRGKKSIFLSMYFMDGRLHYLLHFCVLQGDITSMSGIYSHIILVKKAEHGLTQFKFNLLGFEMGHEGVPTQNDTKLEYK